MLLPRTSSLLSDDAVRHGFFTRKGGVSHGRGDLNCGASDHDDPKHVVENRARVAAYLGGRLQGVSQCHSADVVTLTTLQEVGQMPSADALVTNVPGLALTILTADCGPILFHDPVAQVIGAAHSGWRGSVQAIAARTVEAMVAIGADPSRIRAVLGPTIAQSSYEVGPDFQNHLAPVTHQPMRYLHPSDKDGHWMFNLPALIGDQLAALVGQSDVLDADTYALEDQFFSYRRSTHRREPDYGRQMSGICLVAD